VIFYSNFLHITCNFSQLLDLKKDFSNMFYHEKSISLGLGQKCLYVAAHRTPDPAQKSVKVRRCAHQTVFTSPFQIMIDWWYSILVILSCYLIEFPTV